jgi:branched-chain amino acid aminotransferase
MALEKGKPADVNEVLLQNAAGQVLEGASSNFFAVVGGRLQTAEEGVLPGSLRRAVLQVCAERGVDVDLSAPRADEAGEWEGALLTSTARLALPLDALVLPAGAGERQFPPDSLAHDVAGWVAEYVAAYSQRVLP